MPTIIDQLTPILRGYLHHQLNRCLDSGITIGVYEIQPNGFKTRSGNFQNYLDLLLSELMNSPDKFQITAKLFDTLSENSIAFDSFKVQRVLVYLLADYVGRIGSFFYHEASAQIGIDSAIHGILNRPSSIQWRIYLDRIHFTKSTEIAPGVIIRPSQSWEKERHMRIGQLEHYRRFTNICDSTSVLTIDMPTTDCFSFEQYTPELQERVEGYLRKISIFFKENPLTYSVIIGVPANEREYHTSTMPLFQNEAINGLPDETITPEHEALIPDLIASQLPPVLNTAIRRARSSKRRSSTMDKIVDDVIVLEIICGDDNPESVNYKLSLRASYCSSADPSTMKANQKILKDIYSLRSKAVHRGADGVDREPELYDAHKKLRNFNHSFIRSILCLYLTDQKSVKLGKDIDQYIFEGRPGLYPSSFD